MTSRWRGGAQSDFDDARFGPSGVSKGRKEIDQIHVFVLVALAMVLCYSILNRAAPSDAIVVNTSAADALMSIHPVNRARKLNMDFTARCVLFVDRGDKHVGQFTVGLYGNVAPRTVENFRSYCAGWQDWLSGETRFPKKLTYALTRMFEIQAGKYMAGGDVANATGSTLIGKSVYGPTFHDETFSIKHEVGTVTMGPPPYAKEKDKNGSVFLIVLGEPDQFDGKHVAFGRVIEGWDTIKKLEGL